MNEISPPDIDGGRFADNIVHFARALRRAGLPVGPASVIDAIRAVEMAGVTTRDDFYWTLHAIFVKRRDQHAVFDQAFGLFWRSRQTLEKMLEQFLSEEGRAAKAGTPKAAAARVAQAMFSDLRPPQRAEPSSVEVETRLVASEQEQLRRRDFAQMSADELAEATHAIAKMRVPVENVRTRRLVAAASGGRIDPRRTLRAGLKTGGDMITLRRRRRREMEPPIVVLCDISGSMAHYTRIFLHFMHALSDSRKVTSFLFGTRLTNVTRQLRHRDPDEALAACSASVLDWSGGTRIATALREFNRKWSRRVLGQGAIVLLLTDGLERDVDRGLGEEMDRLQRSCRRLIWLNPLLGYAGFEVKARGIRAMLPYVDEFRPIHSLESVAELCRALSDDRSGMAELRRWREVA